MELVRLQATGSFFQGEKGGLKYGTVRGKKKSTCWFQNRPVS